MQRYLEECDEVLADSLTVEYDSCYFYIHEENEDREEHFESILGQLQFAVTFDLDDLICAIDNLIADIAKGGCKTVDLFTVQHVSTILGHCFPLQKTKIRSQTGTSRESSGTNDGVDKFRIISNGKCKLFWKHLTTSGTGRADFVDDYDLANMAADELAENQMLPLLIHSHMNRTAERMKSLAAVKMIKSLHADVPKTIHESLEFKTDITADKAKAEAVDALRTHFKTNKGAFEKLGMKKMPNSLRLVARRNSSASTSRSQGRGGMSFLNFDFAGIGDRA